MTVPVALARFLNSDQSPWNYMMATAIMYALPPVAIYYAFRRRMTAGMTMGGVTGRRGRRGSELGAGQTDLGEHAAILQRAGVRPLQVQFLAQIEGQFLRTLTLHDHAVLVEDELGHLSPFVVGMIEGEIPGREGVVAHAPGRERGGHDRCELASSLRHWPDGLGRERQDDSILTPPLGIGTRRGEDGRSAKLRQGGGREPRLEVELVAAARDGKVGNSRILRGRVDSRVHEGKV
jgi:hypothetical protein